MKEINYPSSDIIITANILRNTYFPTLVYSISITLSWCFLCTLFKLPSANAELRTKHNLQYFRKSNGTRQKTFVQYLPTIANGRNV